MIKISIGRLSFAIFIAILCFFSDASAQNDNRGTDFWVCFPQNAKYEAFAGLHFKLYITSDHAAKGIVTGPGNIRQEFSLKAGEIISVAIDTTAQVLRSDEIQKLGIHVESDKPVAVFGLSNRKASTDTYVALPTNVLGTAYRAMGYFGLGSDDQFTSQLDIVATVNNTLVTGLLTSNTRGGKKRGEQFTITLNQGDVYQLQGASDGNARNDLTGTLITSDKPVAFFTGHTCAQVPATTNFCDQLLEEEAPISAWGRQFFIGRLLSKQAYVLRVVANEDQTHVFENQLLVRTLAAGDFYESLESNNTLITSDKPVLVAQYATSSEADTVKVGDPFMLFVAPTEQFLQSYQFVTPIKGDWHHYINIVVPLTGINSLRLDGNAISSSYFRRIGITNFSIGQMEIGYGSHTIVCDRPFGLYSYGFGVGGDNYDSYGNCAGERVAPIEHIADTAKPTLEIAPSDTAGDLYLIARDDRINDLGLAMIMVSDSSTNNSIFYPLFDPGTPIVRFRINKVSLSNCIYIKLQDFAKNLSFYSLCPMTQTNSIASSNQGGLYQITPLLIEEQSPHEIYPVNVYPSPAALGQPVYIEYTNSLPELIEIQVLDEQGDIVTRVQEKQQTGAGKHSLTYITNRYPSGNYYLRFLSYAQNGQILYKQDRRFIVIH